MKLYLKSKHKKYYLEQDSRQFTLYEILVAKEGENIGEEYNNVLGYYSYSGFKYLLQQLVLLHCLKKTDSHSILEIMQGARNDINKLIAEAKETKKDVSISKQI